MDITKKEPMIAGAVVSLNGVDLICPPLNFRALETFGEELASLRQLTTSNAFRDLMGLVPILHATLIRNYPNLTIDDIKDGVDLGNYRQLIQAIMNVSGIDDATVAGGVVSPGESSPVPASRPPVQ